MMLLAATQLISVTPPNDNPEWTTNHTPLFKDGVADTYELNNLTHDPEGDNLTYALNAGSAALPTGVTLSGSQLVATTSVAEGTTAGIIIDVDDGTNAAVASSSFSIVTTSFPTLFQDYNGNDFAGEAGALAVNDDWGNTIYDYTPRFAPTIPTLPQPTGSPAKPGSSGVNPNAADEYLVIDATGWDAAINNATYRFVFIAKGTDLKGEATKTVTVGGIAGTPRWIIYWDDVTPSNIVDIEPWNLASGNRVKMPPCNWTGVSYIYCVGLTWGEKDSWHNRMGSFNTTSDFTYYRCHNEYTTTSHNVLWRNNCGDNFHVVKCAFLDSNPSWPDLTELLIQGGDGHRFISCEVRDPATFVEWGDQWAGKDSILENCCVYREQRFDAAGNPDAAGEFTQGEAMIGFKDVSGSGTDIAIRLYGNRCWGTRLTSEALDPTRNTGASIAGSLTNESKAYIDIRWNVFQDNTRTCIRLGAGNILAGTHHHSVVRNIIGDFPLQPWSSAFNYPLYLSYDNTEMYLNTVSNAANAEGFLTFFRTDAGINNLDMMGNFFQDTTDILQDFDTGNQIGYNCWVNALETVNLIYGNDITPTKASLNMGDFTYTRKKLTGPENSTISDIVPTSSTPTSFTALVPTTGGTGNDQVGSRTNIGVDDDF